MPETPDIPGGTQGAHRNDPSFRYSASESEKILWYLKPSESFRAKINPPEVLHANIQGRIISRVARIGSFHMRRVYQGAPASKAEQAQYLQQVKKAATHLSDLLFQRNIHGTPVDLLYTIRRVWGVEKEFEIGMTLERYLDDIVTIADLRMQQRTLAVEEEEHAIKDKQTYLRFEYACTLIAYFQEVTGAQAKAWVQESSSGMRYSDAVGFLLAAMNPVLAAMGQPTISVDVARKEVQTVLSTWAKGIHPEGPNFRYGTFPDGPTGTEDDRYKQHRRNRGDYAPWEKD